MTPSVPSSARELAATQVCTCLAPRRSPLASRSSCPPRAAYTYLSLGCSKAAEARMLSFARQQVGKPFSNLGMARSLLLPRKTDGSSWCACPHPHP